MDIVFRGRIRSDGKENLLQTPVGSEINKKQFDTEEFLKFLENGLAEFKKRNPKP
jgi:hypothetical protein